MRPAVSCPQRLPTLLTPDPPSADSRGTGVLERSARPVQYTWNLADIFPDWDAWEAAARDLGAKIREYRSLQGTLARGPERLLAALQAADELGQLAYKVYYYAALWYDQDQRDNAVNARRQEVQTLLAEWKQATSWFNPELLKIPIETIREWMDAHPDLAVYRFALEDLYRQQEHVLDEEGERLMSLGSKFASVPADAYAALSTADIRYPTITLTSGETVQVTYGQYRAILATRREQEDRARAFKAFHETFAATINTYAALYQGVLERDVFEARARHYGSTIEAALHVNNIPVSIVETLIETARAGTAPLRRYHQLRKRALGLAEYHSYDSSIPLVEFERKYDYGEVQSWIVESLEPLGPEYQADVREAFASRWIDVYENPGKRSGAYSAPVYGVHPYMLLNWNDTIDAVFTLAHEMGHSMHTRLAHAHQPFVYSGYTIFVAEVPSTLSEALLLERLLAQADDPRERVVLLQHAIDEIVATFYTQVLFADFEWQAHRLAEGGRPITADVLGDLYIRLFRDYHGDVFNYDEELQRLTWARIPHFFGSPYYVYQYATCYASTAKLVSEMTEGPLDARRDAVRRYLTLLQSGGNDHPMSQLRKAGVDLADPETVRAVVRHLDRLVGRLEEALAAQGVAA